MNSEELKYYSMLQELFREKMGPQQNGDKILFLGSNIRRPLPIDPENPERGLWGMLDHYKKELHTWRSGKRAIVELVDKEGVRVLFEADTPTLALLKALAHQEGVEI